MINFCQSEETKSAIKENILKHQKVLVENSLGNYAIQECIDVN